MGAQPGLDTSPASVSPPLLCGACNHPLGWACSTAAPQEEEKWGGGSGGRREGGEEDTPDNLREQSGEPLAPPQPPQHPPWHPGAAGRWCSRPRRTWSAACGSRPAGRGHAVGDSTRRGDRGSEAARGVGAKRDAAQREAITGWRTLQGAESHPPKSTQPIWSRCGPRFSAWGTASSSSQGTGGHPRGQAPWGGEGHTSIPAWPFSPRQPPCRTGKR